MYLDETCSVEAYDYYTNKWKIENTNEKKNPYLLRCLKCQPLLGHLNNFNLCEILFCFYWNIIQWKKIVAVEIREPNVNMIRPKVKALMQTIKIKYSSFWISLNSFFCLILFRIHLNFNANIFNSCPTLNFSSCKDSEENDSKKVDTNNYQKGNSPVITNRLKTIGTIGFIMNILNYMETFQVWKKID